MSTRWKIPPSKRHQAFYNSGGPAQAVPRGRNSAPDPPDLEPVLIAHDDPMRGNAITKRNSTGVGCAALR